MSPRRDRMRAHKREHSSYSRNDIDSDNSRMPYRNNDVWTEHVSSSGKKYYYNNLCGISQWDKPNDWVDPRRSFYSSSSRKPEAETSEHFHKRYRDNSNYHPESSYRNHSDFRPNRNPTHYNYTDVHMLHDTDTSSGGSTPVQEVSRLRPDMQDSQAPLTMASALPRNLSHQSSTVTSAHQLSTINNYMPIENINRHTPLNALLKSKMDGIQNVGTYGNFAGSDTPMLTPSLSKYVSNNLVDHVSRWPAEDLEKQAQIFSKESFKLGNLSCAKVCVELKCARALVRHLEIKATLQDQKLLYLRQQIENIEGIKSQNSIMSDDA